MSLPNPTRPSPPSTAPIATALLVLAAVACTTDHEVVLPRDYGDGLAGRSFTIGGTRHTLADLSHVALHYSLDVAAIHAEGHAEVQFRPVETGVPFLLLEPTATAATLDGHPIQLRKIHDPDGVVTLTSLDVELTENTDHVLTVDYPVSPESYVYGPAPRANPTPVGIDFISAMYDGPPYGPPSARYFDRYGPSSIEADQYQMTIDLELLGATIPHQLFTNGTQHQTEPARWTIDFPSYFSTSSFFFELTAAPLVVRQISYHGLEHDIPITVYAAQAEDADAVIAKLPDLFSELEASFGPYAHASFTVDLQGGGMEYAGATVTSPGELSHELCHSWFARGVLPADGRSGWIDEGICTWRDLGYRIPPTPTTPFNLANYSIWYQEMPVDVHLGGAAVFAELETRLAASGGIRPVLRSLYADWRGKPITTEQLLSYVTTKTGLVLDEQFDTYVYDGPPTRTR